MSTDIFLSYASEDSAKAGDLARVLQAEGWSVWWNRTASPGPDVQAEGATALATAKAVVVLWSTFSTASNRVKHQASEAKESNRLIPVLLEDSRIPLTYRSLATVDLRQWPATPATEEISRFKSLVSRLLNTGVSGQKVKVPITTDGLSLSNRVANHIVIGKKKGDAEAAAPDFSLVVERCISDIFLEILKALPGAIAANIETYVMRMAASLQAQTVICNTVDFSRMSVSDMRSLHTGKVTSAQEKAVLGYVNQFCCADGEHNLRLEPGKWPQGTLLCLPLAHTSGGRTYAWFFAKAVNGQWTAATQQQLLKLAAGIRAGVELAS